MQPETSHSTKRGLIWSIVIVFILVIAAVVALVIWRANHRVPRVETIKVQRQKMQRVTLSSGDVRPVQRQLIEINNLSAPVQQMDVHVGERVRRGQTLLKLDTATADAAVSQAENALNQANVAYQRALQGYQSAPGPLQALWLPQVDSTQAAVVQAQQQLAQANAQLANMTVKAAFSGTVLIATENGIDADGNQAPVIELVGPSKQIVVELSEVDATQVHAGMAVTMTTDAYANQTFYGKVTQVAPFASVSQSGSPQVQVLIQPTKSFPVPYGYQVNCRITSTTTEPVPSVPYSALVQQGTSYGAYVVQNHHVRLVTLKLGITSDNAVQVLSGVKVGQVIVNNPPSNLTNGEAVVGG